MDIDKMADQELEKLGVKKKEEPKPLRSSWGASGFDDLESDVLDSSSYSSNRYKNGGWKDPNYWSKKSKSSPRQGDLWSRGTAPAEKLETICRREFNTTVSAGEALIGHVGLDKIVTELRTEFMRSLDKSKVLVLDGRPGNDALYMAIEEIITKHCIYMTDDAEYLSIGVEDK